MLQMTAQDATRDSVMDNCQNVWLDTLLLSDYARNI